MVLAGVYIMDARTEPGPGPLLNRELRAAEGVRAGLGPPLGGSRVVCRFGLFLIDKSAFPKRRAVGSLSCPCGMHVSTQLLRCAAAELEIPPCYSCTPGFATMLGSIGAGRLAAGLVELAVDGPARLVWLTST